MICPKIGIEVWFWIDNHDLKKSNENIWRDTEELYQEMLIPLAAPVSMFQNRQLSS